MKIKMVERLCKAYKTAILYEEENGRQWISTGVSVHVLDGMPYLNEEQMCLVLSINEKQQKDMEIDQRPTKPEAVSIEDRDESDIPTKVMNTRIVVGGLDLSLYELPDESVVAVPYDVVKEYEIRPDALMHLRTGYDGKQYMAISVGMSLRCVCVPYRGKDIVETIGKAYNGMAVAESRETEGQE